MRIKSLDDIKKLGPHARRQVEEALDQQLLRQRKEHNDRKPFLAGEPTSTTHKTTTTERVKKVQPSRVMRTHDGLTYCPWPSPDPFVTVFQRIEAKYGMHDQGGAVLTELIVDGGANEWRFDIALLSPFTPIEIHGKKMLLGYACLIEADGFGFHRSKDAFKNDRAKQTHALKQGFPVKRITNEDARHRLDEVIKDIEHIFSQPRLYSTNYVINAKGRTQSVLSWISNTTI